MDSVDELEQVRAAVALVMSDVEAILGRGIIRVLVHPTEAELRSAFSPMTDLLWSTVVDRMTGTPGYVVSPDGSGVGLSWPEQMEWPEYLVRTAETIQEGVIEDARFWGAAFPPCPVHPNHPLDAEVVNGMACWTCPRGGIEPVEIGHLADSRDGR